MRTVGWLGEGRGEFDMPLPIFTDPDGMVHVIDLGNMRETRALTSEEADGQRRTTAS